MAISKVESGYLASVVFVDQGQYLLVVVLGDTSLGAARGVALPVVVRESVAFPVSLHVCL